MSVDHLYFAWWLDDEGHPWIEHQCVGGKIETWRLPPPWKLTAEGGIEPSFDCKACGRHTFLHYCDRIEAPARQGNESPAAHENDRTP